MKKNKDLRTFMRNFTSFGDAYVALVVVALATGDLKTLGQVALGLLLIYIFGNIIKLILFHDPPSKKFFRSIFEKMESGSFPSQHVARSSFAYSYLFDHLEFPFITIPVMLVVLVAVSRVFLKKHYVVDTIFGLFFGLSIFYLFKVLY